MKIVHSVVSWIVTLLVPFALAFLGMRLTLTHAYLQLAYRLPNVPPDSYGFSDAERLHWSQVAWDYILNNADISFLGNLTFPDGSPLYNERELSHMHDVKGVVKPAMIFGYSVWLALLLAGVWAWLGKWAQGYLRGLGRGGWLTVGLAVVLGVFASTSFWTFFTDFHGLFFTGTSWQFAYSDTLIRLFPLVFWENLFLIIGIIALAGGLALALVFGLKRKRA